MPIYEYRCDSCNHEFEKLQKIADPPPAECPECGAADIRKLVSAAGFRLKGSGWYETDFKSANKRNLDDGGGKDKSEKTESKGGSADTPKSAKSESKSATATSG